MLKTKRTTTLFAEAHTIYDEGLKCLEEACELWDRWAVAKVMGGKDLGSRPARHKRADIGSHRHRAGTGRRP